MEKQRRVYVVPHSHWDREWYFTIEDSNVLLIENLDTLMDVLEQDDQFRAYVFDAQVSVVEEYLKVRPEQQERLKKLIAHRRIFVGPWYTQTDSLLVNKESMIRNLLYGTRIATELGHSMQVGYLPDIFGQNAYLPSIFQGFGINYSILQRGIYTDQLKKNLNFVWKSPDGKTVKTNNIFLGYGPGKFLASNDEYLNEHLRPIIEKLADMNQDTCNLLLPSGGDQVLVRKDFPKVVAELTQKDPNNEYVLSDYETFMADTWADNSDLVNVIEGELIAPQKSRIHNTIRSQRYDSKQLNYLVENKILYRLEPLAVMGQKLGLQYPQIWLDQMWKLLFDAHAHDSIGGCNSDDTNRDIIARLEKVNRITDGLLNIIKKQLTFAISQKLGESNILVLFNTLPRPQMGSMKSVIFTKQPSFSIRNYDGQDITFDIVDQTYVSGGKKVIVTAEGEQEVELQGYYRNVIDMQVDRVPAMGYATFKLKEPAEESKFITNSADQMIENGQYRLTFTNGRLTFENRKTGQQCEDFMRFENVGDAGDSYDFSPLPKDQPIFIRDSKLVKVEKGDVVQKLTVLHQVDLPVDLTARQNGELTQAFEIRTTLELRKNETILRVAHELDNPAADHRLRVLFKTPVENAVCSYADQGFSVLSRPVENPYLDTWKEKKFAEAPVPIFPLENFAAVSEKDATFAVITKGIKEYEVLAASNEIALTLFRSVGLLGRDDLLWRPGRASGINNKVVHTPDAQLKKPLSFEYAIYMTDEALQPQQLFTLTDLFTEHYLTYQLQSLNTFEERLERFEIPMPVNELPNIFSLFNIDNNDVFMSVCKRAYEGDGMIIRLFNPTEDSQQMSIKSDQFSEMMLTDLYEAELEPVNESVEIPAKGYVTVKMK